MKLDVLLDPRCFDSIHNIQNKNTGEISEVFVINNADPDKLPYLNNLEIVLYPSDVAINPEHWDNFKVVSDLQEDYQECESQNCTNDATHIYFNRIICADCFEVGTKTEMISDRVFKFKSVEEQKQILNFVSAAPHYFKPNVKTGLVFVDLYDWDAEYQVAEVIDSKLIGDFNE